MGATQDADPVISSFHRQLRRPLRPLAAVVAPLIEDLCSPRRRLAEQAHWGRVGRRISDSVQLARDGQLA